MGGTSTPRIRRSARKLLERLRNWALQPLLESESHWKQEADRLKEHSLRIESDLKAELNELKSAITLYREEYLANCETFSTKQDLELTRDKLGADFSRLLEELIAAKAELQRQDGRRAQLEEHTAEAQKGFATRSDLKLVLEQVRSRSGTAPNQPWGVRCPKCHAQYDVTLEKCPFCP